MRFSKWALNSSSQVHHAGHSVVARVPHSSVLSRFCLTSDFSRGDHGALDAPPSAPSRVRRPSDFRIAKYGLASSSTALTRRGLELPPFRIRNSPRVGNTSERQVRSPFEYHSTSKGGTCGETGMTRATLNARARPFRLKGFVTFIMCGSGMVCQPDSAYRK